MITILVVAVSLAVITSFFCSLSEASFYSVPIAHARHIGENGSRGGRVLLELKAETSRTIAAILIMNTIANIVGASVAGAIAGDLFSDQGLIAFSVLFTVLILFLGEIIPKVLGVRYAKDVAPAIAIPLRILVTALAPLIVVAEFVAKRIGDGSTQPLVSAEEVESMSQIGQEEGTLDALEGSIIRNIIGLDKVLIRDVLTPRVVVFRLAETQTVGDVKDEIVGWKFSRIPIYRGEDPDDLVGYATQRDIYQELVQGRTDTPIGKLARPLETVPDVMSVDRLLLRMFERKEHLCAVVDEHGALAGIISLEDIIEEIVGREIVDEYDTVTDLRAFAKLRQLAQQRKKSDSLPS